MLHIVWAVNWTSEFKEQIPRWLVNLSSSDLHAIKEAYSEMDTYLVQSDVLDGYGDINLILSNPDLFILVDFLIYIFEHQTDPSKFAVLDLLHIIFVHKHHEKLTPQSLEIATKVNSKICEALKGTNFSLDSNLALKMAWYDLIQYCF